MIYLILLHEDIQCYNRATILARPSEYSTEEGTASWSLAYSPRKTERVILRASVGASCLIRKGREESTNKMDTSARLISTVAYRLQIIPAVEAGCRSSSQSISLTNL